MEMLIGGTWRPAASGRAEDVTSPFDGAVIGSVPVAGADDVRAHPAVGADFLDALVPKVETIRTGDPGSPPSSCTAGRGEHGRLPSIHASAEPRTDDDLRR